MYTCVARCIRVRASGGLDMFAMYASLSNATHAHVQRSQLIWVESSRIMHDVWERRLMNDFDMQSVPESMKKRIGDDPEIFRFMASASRRTENAVISSARITKAALDFCLSHKWITAPSLSRRPHISAYPPLRSSVRDMRLCISVIILFMNVQLVR